MGQGSDPARTTLGCCWTHPHLGSHVPNQQLFFSLHFLHEGNNLSPEQIKSDLHEI